MNKRVLTALMWIIWVTGLHAATSPLIGDVPDQVIAKGTSTGTLYFVVGDAVTTFAALTVTASSNNTSLVPNNTANLALGGTTSQRTIVVTPASGPTGTATVTLTVANGAALTASSTFTVTVTAPNTPPTVAGLPSYQIVSPGQTPAPISFTVSDAETVAGSLDVAATSSNTALVPNGNISLVNNGATRTIQVSPVTGQRGVAVIRLRVTDALGASAQGKFIFSVFDAASANNGFRRPRGIYVLDSAAGSQVSGVSMRDANIRNVSFVDGYLLRVDWPTLEPTNGAYDFTIIGNIFTKLPASQKLSLIIRNDSAPAWLLSLPGISTWTAGSPSVTAPLPWDAVAQERFRLLLVALGNYVVDGVQLRNHPRLAAVNLGIAGLAGGIREPTQIKISNMPGYSRTTMQNAVQTYLSSATDNFPYVPVQIGFWTYVDNQDASFGGVTAWEQLRQAVLAQFNGVSHPRVGFFMDNLAANRPAANSDPWTGLPNTTFTAPLYLSQNSTFASFQVLGSWARPFNFAHVDNNLNGSPEDGMDYGFNTFQCRYYEHYQTDIDFASYSAEYQRWHDFINALPNPPLPLVFSSNQGRVTMDAANGTAINLTLSASGGTGPYTWTLTSGTLPTGVTLSSNGFLSGTSTQGITSTFIVQATDATGGTATQQYTLTIEPPGFAATVTRNADGSATLTWPTTIGGRYQVEYSDDLVKWTALGSAMQAASSIMTWTDDGTQTGTLPSAATRRFYRVHG